MISVNPRRRRRLVPSVVPLESRRLLTFSVTSALQDGSDYVGIDASQGSDGIQDLDISITNLTYPFDPQAANPPAAQLTYIDVTSPNGFHWQTTPDSSGYAFAEFIANPDSYQGHLYINPEVKSTIPPSGGSTGTLIQLVNGDPLTITVNYTTGGTSPQSYSEQQIIIPESTSNTYHITSATDPVSEPSAPTYNNNSITVTDDNQDETFPEWAEGQNGFVHLVVSFPASLDLSNWAVDFTTTPYYGTELPLIFSLSDDARNEWDSMRVTNFYNHLYAFYNSEEPNQASLYFHRPG